MRYLGGGDAASGGAAAGAAAAAALASSSPRPILNRPKRPQSGQSPRPPRPQRPFPSSASSAPCCCPCRAIVSVSLLKTPLMSKFDEWWILFTFDPTCLAVMESWNLGLSMSSLERRCIFSNSLSRSLQYIVYSPRLIPPSHRLVAPDPLAVDRSCGVRRQSSSDAAAHGRGWSGRRTLWRPRRCGRVGPLPRPALPRVVVLLPGGRRTVAANSGRGISGGSNSTSSMYM